MSGTLILHYNNIEKLLTNWQKHLNFNKQSQIFFFI